MHSSLKTASVLLVTLVTATSLVACGSDDSSPTASESEAPTAPPTTATATPTPTSTASAPSTSLPSPTPVPTRPVSVPSETPEDDENGEFAGQLIIEYPGQPLRRTTSTAFDENVEALQIRLNEIGYTVAISGNFNAATETAVKRFQRDSGLTADGIVREPTWAAMFTFEG